MGVRKVIGAIALATVAVLALGGCAVTGSLVDKARLDFELTKLSSALKEIPTVVDVTSALELHGDYSYSVTLTVMSTAPTESDTVAILDAVDDAFSEGTLSTQPRWFSLENNDGPFIGQSAFGLSDDRVAADVHYLYALSAAYGGPMSMGLGEPWNEPATSGDYQRSISSSTSVTNADWDAMRAVPDPSPSIFNSWDFLGLATTGSLPDDDIVTVLDHLAPLLPAGGEGNAWMSLDGDRLSVQVSTLENETGPFADLALWSRVTSIASVLSDSELPGAILLLQTSSGSNAGSGTVHFYECATEAIAMERDAEFFEALAASGVVFPLGSGAGWC